MALCSCIRRRLFKCETPNQGKEGFFKRKLPLHYHQRQAKGPYTASHEVVPAEEIDNESKKARRAFKCFLGCEGTWGYQGLYFDCANDLEQQPSRRASSLEM